MGLGEIDEIFDFYEKRYNLTKMATDCGISLKKYQKLSSEDKFLVLSKELKNSNKTNLASFFFGKLFEVSGDIVALINKIDCLLDLWELEEASRYNKIGFELFLETPDIDTFEIEKKLYFQNARIKFYTDKFANSKSICESGIIKFKQKEFYELLCANFVALSDFKNAYKLFKKYGNKFDGPIDFIQEAFMWLVDVNLLIKGTEFVGQVFKLSSKKKNDLITQVNDYYFLNKDKSIISNYFKKNINLLNANIKSI